MIENFKKGSRLWVIVLAVGVLGLIMFFKYSDVSSVYNSMRVKSLMEEAQLQAQIYFKNQNPPSYTASTMLTPAPACTGDMFSGNFPYNLNSITGSASAWPKGTTLSCQAAERQYAISASLPVGNRTDGSLNVWCVDSTGRSSWVTYPLAQGDTNCNE